MPSLPPPSTPSGPADAATVFGVRGQQLHWHPFLTLGMGIAGLTAILTMSLGTGDTWDRVYDRPLYLAVLLGSVVMAVRLWLPGQSLVRYSWQLLQAVSTWLLVKFALLLLVSTPDTDSD